MEIKLGAWASGFYGEFTRVSKARRSEFTGWARRLSPQCRRLDPGQHARSRSGPIWPSRSQEETPMSTVLLWLLVLAIGVYLLIAILFPEKF
jgi:type VI protein secretion system component VasF